MKKQIGKNLMQKWKNKIRVRLSALDKKKMVLTNIPYALAAFYQIGHFFFIGTVREKILGTSYYMRWNMHTGFLLDCSQVLTGVIC